jgi:hypothetical protein
MEITNDQISMTNQLPMTNGQLEIGNWSLIGIWLIGHLKFPYERLPNNAIFYLYT